GRRARALVGGHGVGSGTGRPFQLGSGNFPDLPARLAVGLGFESTPVRWWTFAPEADCAAAWWFPRSHARRRAIRLHERDSTPASGTRPQAIRRAGRSHAPLAIRKAGTTCSTASGPINLLHDPWDLRTRSPGSKLNESR